MPTASAGALAAQQGPVPAVAATPARDPLQQAGPDLLQAWLAIDNWTDSKAFFVDHGSELISNGAADALHVRLAGEPANGRLKVHAALVSEEFAGRGELGYRYLTAEGPDDGVRQLIEGVMEQQPELTEELMGAAAALVEAATGPGKHHAVLLRATSVALGGNIDKAKDLVRDARPQVPPPSLVNWVRQWGSIGDKAGTSLEALRLVLLDCGEPAAGSSSFLGVS